ncbi:Myblike DNAbinding domain-containing protein [Actinomortierella wolfii]|nr:Myblike DNAbinding domain-containing protein [Actinomortierella wolfii]
MLSFASSKGAWALKLDRIPAFSLPMQLPPTNKVAAQQRILGFLRQESTLATKSSGAAQPPSTAAVTTASLGSAGASEDHTASSENSSGGGEGSNSSVPASTQSKQSYHTKYQFTPEIDAELIRLHNAGKSWAAIGSLLGIPFRACNRRYAQYLDPKLANWTEEESARLDELVAQGEPWNEIARQLNKTSVACQTKWRYTSVAKDSQRNRHFDTLQSHVLLRIVEEVGEHDWKAVLRRFMMQLGSRDMAKVTPLQLRHQYYRLKRSTNPWTVDEETKLIRHVLEHGTEQWDKIAEEINGKHSAEDCRIRWTYLDMRNKKPTDKLWYKGEQSNFWRYWLRFGDDWAKIARSMRKRTPEMCQRFYETATASIDKSDPEKYQAEVRALAERMSNYNTINWSKQNSERLWKVTEALRLSNPLGRVTWTYVEQIMQLQIDPTQYKHHYYYLKSIMKSGGLAGPWSEGEVRTLVSAVQEVGRDWRKISKDYLPHRNPKALCHKFKSVSNRGAYISEQEYFTLLETVKKEEEKLAAQEMSEYGQSSPSSAEPKIDWENVAKAMPGWTGTECQRAYASSFRSIIRSSQWTPEEDERLIKTVDEVGKKDWINIARKMGDMDSWACRVRYAQLQSTMNASKPVEQESDSTTLDSQRS